MKWYLKTLSPWGISIGIYYEAYPVVRGVTRRISKHVTKSGKLRFYSFVRRVLSSRGDRYVYRSRSLDATVTALRRDTAR